jgi:signal transduction histidine kinase
LPNLSHWTHLRFGGTRLVLTLGFGSLLLLMGFGALQTETLLRRIQDRSQAIERRFLERSKMLIEIRTALYLSGTVFRDYVLDRDQSRSEAQLRRLDQLHREMDRRLEDYERGITPSEDVAFERLKSEIEGYWRLLNPALSWSAERRETDGYPFLRDEVFTRRTAVLDLANQVAALNERQLVLGQAEVAALFSGFRSRIRFTLLGIVGLGVCLALVAGKRILHLEGEAAERFAQTEHARGELRDLSARLVEVQETERRSIARELHDEVGQSLSAVLIEVTNLNAALRTGEPEQVSRHANSIKALTEGCVRTVRNLSLLLRPSMLDDLGLLPALEWQAREVSRRTDLQVNIVDQGIPTALPDQYKTCIYRVVQEALHNAERHARAKSVTVTLGQERNRLHLTVEDDGRGFDPERHKGLGLLGIEERATTLGGDFAVLSKPGEGTRLSISLPMAGR